MFSELILTDGTIKIDLLSANKNGWGWGVTSYIPARAGYKGGGVWRDSPLAVGRQLAQGIRTNFNDALTLNLSYRSQREIVYAFEELDLLLEKSAAYWLTTWQQTPVYIQAQAHGESARRYALVYQATFDRYFDTYNMPYLTPGRPAVAEVILGIERGPWMDLAPGSSESVPITHEKNSGTAFDEPDGDQGLFVGNYHQYSNDTTVGGLQVIFRDDGGIFSTNLLDGNPPYDLVVNPGAVNDAVYFGSTRPFFGLVFDITAINVTGAATWEFWDGATWSALTPSTDGLLGTTVFGNTGITHAHWSVLSTWAQTTVGADMTQRYYVRYRISSGSGQQLTQGNRHVYATAVNYVEIAADEIRGTLSAASKITMDIWHGAASNQAYDGPFVWLGLRSVDRGEDFVSQINVGGGNPPNVTVARVTANATVVTDPTTPGGQHIAVTNETTLVPVAMFNFGNPVYTSFYGRYRLFARVTTDDDTGASRMRFRVTNTPAAGAAPNLTFFTGETKVIPAAPAASTSTNILIDLGYVTLPPSGRALYADTLGVFSIALDAIVPASYTLEIVNIVLMPVDEWAAELTGTLLGSQDLRIILDNVDNPKTARAYIYGAAGLLAAMSANPFLHSAALQRLWFLFNFGGTGTANNSVPATLATIRISKAERNLSLRSA